MHFSLVALNADVVGYSQLVSDDLEAACSLFMGGRVEQAAAMAEMVLEHQPHNLEALLVLTAAQVELGWTGGPGRPPS